MRGSGRTVEEKIGRIAARQRGNVTREQLLDAGVSRSGIERRVRKGLLIPKHPGVYRVGHAAPSVEADYMAAVLACGEGAVLSGRAAAYLHRLVRGRPPKPEVTAPTERRLRGVLTHRARRSMPRAVRASGIPATTVARTLVDLAAVLGEDDLARACHEAGVLHRTTPRQVEAELSERPGAPGARKLRRIMSGEVQVALSRLERRFRQLLREDGLALPLMNRSASGRRVDCRWPEHRLTVELDSYRYHSSRRSWEEDRRREREAYARGDDFRRYTWGDVFENTEPMRRELRGLLAEPPS